MRLWIVAVLTGLSLILAACSQAGGGGAASSSGKRNQPEIAAAPGQPALADNLARGGSDAAERAVAPASAPAESASVGAASTESSQVSAPRLDRMIVANINLSVTVEDAIMGAQQAEVIAERYGGFVSSSNVRSLEKVREGSITVRVPTQRLSDALRDLRALGIKVTEETRATQDVTEEFTDVESNIRNLRATEAQLLALMEKATRLDDVLRFQRETTSIRGQIERLEGRRRVLENKSDLATIALKLTEPVGQAPRDGWSPLQIASQAFSALAVIGRELATILIWLLVFSPLIAMPVGLIWIFARNRNPRPTAPQTP